MRSSRNARVIRTQLALPQLRDDIHGIAEQLARLMQVEHADVVVGGGKAARQMIERFQLLEDIGVAGSRRLDRPGRFQLRGFALDQQRLLNQFVRDVHENELIVGQQPGRAGRRPQRVHRVIPQVAMSTASTTAPR